jgi:hypothetical protein
MLFEPGNIARGCALHGEAHDAGFNAFAGFEDITRFGLGRAGNESAAV